MTVLQTIRPLFPPFAQQLFAVAAGYRAGTHTVKDMAQARGAAWKMIDSRRDDSQALDVRLVALVLSALYPYEDKIPSSQVCPYDMLDIFLECCDGAHLDPAVVSAAICKVYQHDLREHCP